MHPRFGLHALFEFAFFYIETDVVQGFFDFALAAESVCNGAISF
jgi:hypothetical protein